MSGQGRDNGNVASGSENTTKRRLPNTPEKPPAKRTTVTEYILVKTSNRTLYIHAYKGV